MNRSTRFNFRPLLAALVALAVLASPVLSAESCALACAAGHEETVAPASDAGHKCCAPKHAEHRSEKSSPKSSSKSDDGKCKQCASACCRPVTTIASHLSSIDGETLALSFEAAPLLAREFVSDHPIFHPPRV